MKTFIVLRAALSELKRLNAEPQIIQAVEEAFMDEQEEARCQEVLGELVPVDESGAVVL